MPELHKECCLLILREITLSIRARENINVLITTGGILLLEPPGTVLLIKWNSNEKKSIKDAARIELSRLNKMLHVLY